MQKLDDVMKKWKNWQKNNTFETATMADESRATVDRQPFFLRCQE